MYEQFGWTSGARSHMGRVRTNNEDACLAQAERRLWAVADGMGGHSVGDYASRRVVEVLRDIALPRRSESFVAAVRAQLQAVNRELRAEAAARNVARIGTTVAVLVACDRHCRLLWAGDSRIYLYRGSRLKLLTRDHSILQELRSRGHLDSANALAAPVQHGITRAVGADDVLNVEEGITDIMDGDVFLLCSDGLTNEVHEEDIASALRAGCCQQAADALVDLALERGGRDNVSAVVVRADDVVNSEQTLFNPAI